MRIVVVPLLVWLTGCTTTVSIDVPPGEQPATVVGQLDRTQGLTHWRSFALLSVNDQPVSYGIMSERRNTEVQVPAGIHSFVVEASFNTGFLSDGPWEAIVRIEAPVEAGRRYRVNGTVRGTEFYVWLEDQATGQRAGSEFSRRYVRRPGPRASYSGSAQASRPEDLGLTPADVPPPPVSFHEPPDFGELREAYGRRVDFSQRCERDRPAQPFMEAVEAGQYREAADILIAWLQQCPVDAPAHLWVAAALDDAGDAVQAGIHFDWFLGITDSVMESGDGKTPETAYVTISVGEGYALLVRLGLSPVRRALLTGDTLRDAITAEDEHGTERTIFFNPAWHFVRLLFGIRGLS